MTTRSDTRSVRQIYLDAAATSYQKPPEVLRAMSEHMTLRGGNPGRGAHRLSLSAAEEVFACREAASALFGSSHPERVVFTMNTTHALNLAIRGCLSPGDHVLCSDMEHNSVWRPLQALQRDGIITYDTFSTFPSVPIRTQDMILRDIERRLTPKTRMIVCAHASNVCSASLPIGAIGRLCRRRGLLFVVDGAQSAGILPIHMEDMCIDALCVPGHKGLMGPQGVGMLLLGERAEPSPLMFGGNGVESLSGDMSDAMPERYEAGTLPGGCISGLRAGIDFVRRTGIDLIRRREALLGARLRAGLSPMPHVTLYAPEHEGGVLLFSIRGMSSEEVGGFLDRLGICVRPGFHCAALAHRTLGTPPEGAVRVSFGYFNTEKECDSLISAVGLLGR